MSSLFEEIFGSTFRFNTTVEVRPRRWIFMENGTSFAIGWMPAGEQPILIICDGKDVAREAIRATIGSDLTVSLAGGKSSESYTNPDADGPLGCLERSDLRANADRPAARTPARFLRMILALSDEAEHHPCPPQPGSFPDDELIASWIEHHSGGTVGGALLTRENARAQLHLFFSPGQLRTLVAERGWVPKKAASCLLGHPAARMCVAQAAYPTPLRFDGDFVERLVHGHRCMHAHLG